PVRSAGGTPRGSKGAGHLQPVLAQWTGAAASRAHGPLRLPATKAKPRGRGDRAVFEGGGAIRGGGTGRGRSFLLGARGATRSRKSGAAFENGGDRGAHREECAGGASVFARGATGHRERSGGGRVAAPRKGDAAEAAALLEPFAAAENDAAFQDTFADALMQAGQLDRARQILEKLLREKNEGVARLFELADLYAGADLDAKAVEILQTLKRRMFADKKQNQFAAQMDALGAKHPESETLLEFWAALYNELNRESQYFEILIKLFDVYFNEGNFAKACDALERRVDIDAYDHRNQLRLERLRGHVDETFVRRVGGRLAKSATMPAAAGKNQAAPANAPASPPASEEA